METRYAHHPDQVREMDTAALRRSFLVEDLFRPGELRHARGERRGEWSPLVGADYYLPPSGRIFGSATYSQAKSDNAADYIPTASKGTVYTMATHYDGNVFFDVTPAVRLGLSYQHRETKCADGVKGKNDRYHFTAYYNF